MGKHPIGIWVVSWELYSRLVIALLGDRAIAGQNKSFLKVLYFIMHVLCFMGIVDVKYVILITLLTAIPAVSTHLPFLRKEHIIFL